MGACWVGSPTAKRHIKERSSSDGLRSVATCWNLPVFVKWVTAVSTELDHNAFHLCNCLVIKTGHSDVDAARFTSSTPVGCHNYLQSVSNSKKFNAITRQQIFYREVAVLFLFWSDWAVNCYLPRTKLTLSSFPHFPFCHLTLLWSATIQQPTSIFPDDHHQQQQW